MNRINQTLASLKEEGRKALVTYVVSGDPDPANTLDALNSLVAGGADIIEVGMPFSDPMAEGPVIQKAHERALSAGASVRKTLACVAEFRKHNTQTPIVLMGYVNPIEKMGYENFCKAASEAGVDGLLTVDLPPEEAHEVSSVFKEYNLENIYLVAPTTASSRIKDICEVAQGFVYYVSFKGVTGASHIDSDAVAKNVAAIKEVASTPVLVGFGIKDAVSAKSIAAVSDGVVVGSALVSIMAEHASDLPKMNKELEALVRSMRDAIDEL